MPLLVGLTLCASPLLAMAASNLLVNGDFENEPNWGTTSIYYDGSATALIGSLIPGWTIAPGHAATVHASPGAYPVIDGHYSLNTDGEGYNNHNVDIYQDFPTQAGASYDLSFKWQIWMTWWGESEYGVDTSNTRLEISVQDLATRNFLYDGFFNSTYSAGTVSTGGPVDLVSTNFLGNGDVYRLEIRESPESGINDNKFIVDDFSMTVGGGGGGGTQKPAITITSPASGITVTNNSVGVEGTAASGVGLANVYCRVDGGAWSAAHGTANWSFTASLSPGTNPIEAYAADTAGNLSTTDTVTVIYQTTLASGTLQLRTNGMGSITRNFKGSSLMVGKSYTVTAVPGPGQVFAGWTGDIVSSQNPLTFTMPSTLTLQANFNVNPFTALQGTYSGLFLGTNAVGPTNSGAVTLTLTPKGAYTGKLWLGGSSLSLMGAFNAAGLALETIGPSSLNPVALTLQLDLPAGQQVAGTVQAKGWGATLLAYRAAFNAQTNPAPSGTYTMVVAGDAYPSAPLGFSFGTAVVTTGGQVTFKGTLADGTAVLPTVSSLTASGLWPLYLSLYQGHGLMIGWVTVTPLTLEGQAINWVKAGGAGGSYYPGGFAYETYADGSKYVAPAAGHALLNWSNGVVSLGGGNLSANLTNTITVNAKNQVQVTGANADKLKLTLTPATGSFSGSFVPPGTTKPVSISGVVVTDLEWAGGFFLGTSQGGSVIIGKQP